MWDFYGLSQWILKYVPRHGRILEAGSGLGRYVFYLHRMGLDIEGIDFSESTIDFLNEWKKKYNFSANFIHGDVTDLPYENNFLSGYLSFGVIEHFIEGPQKALKEAHRLLRPGGIAIISTPSISLNIFIRKVKKNFKKLIKRLLLYKQAEEKFFQYWYRPKKLKRFVEAAGLKVTKYSGADLFYMFCEMGRYSSDNIKENFFAYKFSHKFEKSFLSTIGAQSITISVKVDKTMYCFFCGEKKARESSLLNFDIPICMDCIENEIENEISGYYRKNVKPAFSQPYSMNPLIKSPTLQVYDFCEKKYKTDELFEDYGLSKNVCPGCLKRKEINLILSNQFLKPIWRKRGNIP
ncbi:MAG: class I SAM-dependent methyltransferase [Candidatus Aminicenantes bacterium]